MGARLAYGARQGKPFTQAALAKALGVSAGTISQWESDTTKPAHEMWPKLAAKLGAKADWLAWGMVVDEGQEFPGEAGESRKNG